ncbi:hypothetical protein G3N18_14280 [Microbacterium sp. 2C]|nr:hypothetical protein [Microbacterium paulum]
MSGNPQAGGTITVTGSGFTAGQNVLVEVHSDPYALGTATVGADGRFTISGTLPADFPAGEHSVVAIVDGRRSPPRWSRSQRRPPRRPSRPRPSRPARHSRCRARRSAGA